MAKRCISPLIALRDELDNPLFVGQKIVSDRYCEAMSLLIQGLKCDKNGKFIQRQCVDDECFCVDINTGDELTPIRRIPNGRHYLECNQDLPCLSFWYGSSRSSNAIVFECSYDGSYTNTLIDLENGQIWGFVGKDEEPEIMEEDENDSYYDRLWEEVVYEQEEEDNEETSEIMEDNEDQAPNWHNYWDFYWR